MKHILMADDDRVTASLYGRALQSKGNAIHFAYDVMQAIMTITRSRVDAVILDMHMPGGTGLDVIHRMKASNRLGPIPIIVISGTSDEVTAAKALEMGADAFFTKPVDMHVLHDVVYRILAGEPLQPVPAVPEVQSPELSYNGA